jgi:hypothetical protein
MNCLVRFAYLSHKFELTVHNPKVVCNVTKYDLLYKGWCPVGTCIESTTELILIIGYFVCYVDVLYGVVRLITSLGETIDDNTIWSWIVGAIQRPVHYEA